MVNAKDKAGLRTKPGIGETESSTDIAGALKANMAFILANRRVNIPEPILEKVLRLLDQVNLLDILADFLESALICF